jgi:outer membrane receptor for ferrienterochelin and colicins
MITTRIKRSARVAACSTLVSCVLATLTVPRPALADGFADEADLHFRLGADAYTKGDYTSALEHFLASNRLVPNKNVVYNIARTFERLQRYADAHRYYVDAREGERDKKTIAEINGAIARIAPSVAVLRVETTPPNATIYLNRRDLGSRGRTPKPLAVAPGKYNVILEIPGYEPAVVPSVKASLGKEVELKVALKRIVGTLKVEISGAKDAEVHVDDEHSAPVCTAPCVAEIPPGRHIVYFTREGYQAAPIEVNITANQTSRALAKLAPITGSVMVSAEERDAIVEIDDKPMGFTPTVIQGVATGKRRLRVALRGFAPVERDIEVKANKQTEVLDLRMTPLRQVTAVSRLAENIEDAPSSVSIIDGQEIRAFGYPHIAEALRGTRGVYLNNDRSYYSAGFRGLGEPNDYGNRVLVLSDGQSLNDNLLNSSYIGPDGRQDLGDIDRIEVVRGPGSLLYGTGAFSGVVNLITRPRDEPSGVHGGLSTYDNAVIRGRLGFHYNFNQKSGVWASVVGARSNGIDSTIRLVDPGNGSANRTLHNVDQFVGATTAGRFWYGPFTIQWLYNTREQHLPQGAYGTVLNDPRTQFVDKRYMVEARFEPQVTDWLQIFARAHANRYEFHGEYVYEPSTIEDYYGTWFGFEGRLVMTPKKFLRFTIGGEGQFHPQVKLEGCCVLDNNDRITKDRYMDESAPYNIGAAYAIADISPTSWFRVSGGARLDVYSSFGAIVVPRLALIFKPFTGNVIKLMGGRAFRAPSRYEAFYNDGGITQVPAVDSARKIDIGPESIYQGELEISQRFAENWVALGTGYVGYVTGIINTVADSPGSDLIRYANGEPALLAGGEAEIRREWRQGWMLAASYAFQHGRYLKAPEELAGIKNPNLRLINAPDHMGSFRAVFPVVSDVLSIAGRVSVESGRRIDLQTNDETRPAFIGDIAISGNLRRYGVRYVAGVYNVADYRWETPVTASSLSRTLVQNGRTFMANLVLTYPP